MHFKLKGKEHIKTMSTFEDKTNNTKSILVSWRVATPLQWKKDYPEIGEAIKYITENNTSLNIGGKIPVVPVKYNIHMYTDGIGLEGYAIAISTHSTNLKYLNLPKGTDKVKYIIISNTDFSRADALCCKSRIVDRMEMYFSATDIIQQIGTDIETKCISPVLPQNFRENCKYSTLFQGSAETRNGVNVYLVCEDLCLTFLEYIKAASKYSYGSVDSRIRAKVIQALTRVCNACNIYDECSKLKIAIMDILSMTEYMDYPLYKLVIINNILDELKALMCNTITYNETLKYYSDYFNILKELNGRAIKEANLNFQKEVIYKKITNADGIKTEGLKLALGTLAEQQKKLAILTQDASIEAHVFTHVLDEEKKPYIKIKSEDCTTEGNIILKLENVEGINYDITESEIGFILKNDINGYGNIIFYQMDHSIWNRQEYPVIAATLRNVNNDFCMVYTDVLIESNMMKPSKQLKDKLYKYFTEELFKYLHDNYNIEYCLPKQISGSIRMPDNKIEVTLVKDYFRTVYVK